MKNIKLLILTGFIFILSGCSLFRGELVTTFHETIDRGLDGNFSGNLYINKSLMKNGPFVEGANIALNITRSGYTIEETHSVYQVGSSDDEDFDECVYDSEYTLSDYESQSGCDVVEETEYKGEIEIILTDLNNQFLGPGDFDAFSETFNHNLIDYNLRFGEDFSNTENSDSSSFDVKITQMNILLEDAMGTISLY
ncbi:MAG: hypothetical protein OEZ13_03790 [Spirochaetia bacterium]|nr:hypothetical protein [Spirochaetia bacterium]